MLRFKGRRVLASLLIMSFAFNMVACSSDDTSSTSADDTPATEEVVLNPGDPVPEDQWVRLEYLKPGTGIYSEDDNLIMRKIAEETGVYVQTVTVPEDKYTVLKASGDFGSDMAYVRNVDVDDVIAGGLLIPCDDLVEEYGPNVQKYAGSALDYNRQYNSNGTGQLYMIPTHVDRSTDDLGVTSSFYVAPSIRWDYYEELGYPEINNEDDLLSVLRQMQDLHPTSADGKKTYAISRYVNDDPIWLYQCMYQNAYGQVNVDNWFVTQGEGNEIAGNILDDDYILWRALNFYNKAYRMGIFDPESFTQKIANVEEKAKNGQMFFEEYGGSGYNKSIATIDGEDAGFEPIFTAFPVYVGSSINKFGWGGGFNITSSCENPEAAMKFIDYLFSPEGARLAYSGIEGVHWEYDENGVPVPTQETIDNKGKKEWDDAQGFGVFQESVGLGYGVKAEDGYAVDLNSTEAVALMNNSTLDTKYSERYGVTIPGYVPLKLVDEGKLEPVELDQTIKGFMPTRPDNLTRIMTKGYDYIYKLIPRAIMAESEEEFNSIISEAIDSLASFGVGEVVDWTIEEFENAKTEAAAFQ